MKLIPLRNHRGEVVAETKVDDADFEWLSQWRWSFHNKQYASRYNDSLPDGRIYMHRLIVGLARGDGREVDHINRDKLDNRRSNLRAVTRSENTLNHPGFLATSRHRGVSWFTRDRKWRAQIVVAGRAHHLGYFDAEDDAAAAVKSFLLAQGVPAEALA